MNKTCCIIGCLAVSLAVSPPQNIYAALGGNLDSVAKDHKSLRATRRTATSLTKYSVHEITTDVSTVREYMSPAGVVFAIAWDGSAHPDLTILLGPYKSEYQQALQNNSSRKGMRHSQIKSDRIVVEKWGHMRNMKGRAYIPVLMPSGVTIDEIN